MRHSTISSLAPAAHVVPDGLHADFSITGYAYGATPTDGVTATGASALVFAELETDSTGAPVDVVATFSLLAADGTTVVATASGKAAVAPGGSTTVSAEMPIPDGAQCWSVARPYLHTLSVSLAAAGAPGAPLDTANATVGLRGVRWDADEGSFVNEQRVRLRGFCDHESFAGVGMAIADRLQLFRFQAQRGMGGNGRRFSTWGDAGGVARVLSSTLT